MTNLLLCVLIVLAGACVFLLWRLLNQPKPREVGTPCGFLPQSPCEARPCAAEPCRSQPVDLAPLTQALALLRADIQGLAKRPQAACKWQPPAVQPARPRGMASAANADVSEIRAYLLARQERRAARQARRAQA
jgi:hypothetical protein